MSYKPIESEIRQDLYNYFNGIGEYPDISVWDVSDITDMSYLFKDVKEFIADIDFTEWNVGNVVNMKSMFEGCMNFNGRTIENWDVKKVVNMKRMFKNCTSLNTILCGWNIKSLINKTEMFANTTMDVKQQPLFDIYELNEEWNSTSLIGSKIAMGIFTHGGYITDEFRKYAYKMEIESISEATPGCVSWAKDDFFGNPFGIEKKIRRIYNSFMEHKEFDASLIGDKSKKFRYHTPILKGISSKFTKPFELEYNKSGILLQSVFGLEKKSGERYLSKTRENQPKKTMKRVFNYFDKSFGFDSRNGVVKRNNRQIMLIFSSGFKYSINPYTLDNHMFDLEVIVKHNFADYTRIIRLIDRIVTTFLNTKQIFRSDLYSLIESFDVDYLFSYDFSCGSLLDKNYDETFIERYKEHFFGGNLKTRNHKKRSKYNSKKHKVRGRSKFM